MKQLFVLCEGPTEEGFANEFLAPYLKNYGFVTTPTIYKTKRDGGKTYKGGGIKYEQLKKDILGLCQYSDAVVTTMLDYYQFPNNINGFSYVDEDSVKVALKLEEFIENDIQRNNFVSYLSIHEFETIFFAIAENITAELTESEVDKLIKVRSGFVDVEHINTSRELSPSHRMMKIHSEYNKILSARNILSSVSIDTIRTKYAHFDQWIKKLISKA